MTRAASLLVGLLILSVVAVPGVVADDEVTDIGDDHGLDDASAIQEWRSSNHVEEPVDEYDITLSIAEDRNALSTDVKPALVADQYNDYLHISNDEGFERTYRFLIPREYVTPYTREEVNSITSDHVASFDRARDGEYLEVVIHMEGAGDVVLPLDRTAGWSYEAVEAVDSKISAATGISPLGETEGWQYLNGENLSKDGAVAIETSNPGNALVQYDSKPAEAGEAWINAPEGDTDSPVYTYTQSGEQDKLYVVTTVDDPPDVRVKETPSMQDKVRGWIEDAKQIGERLTDSVNDLVPEVPFGGGGSDGAVNETLENQTDTETTTNG